MVWPFSSSKSASEDAKVNAESPATRTDEPVLTNYAKGQKFLLEDTKPRFANESSSVAAKEQERASLTEAWKTVSKNDFSVERLLSIPCFRDAGIGGFTSMLVVGSVMFLYHKNPARAANWSVGGFMLGSIVGWEQCRMRRRRSFQVAAMAKQTVAAKERPMMHTPQSDGSAKKEWSPSAAGANASKPWYKFW